MPEALDHGRKLPVPALLAKMYTLRNMSLGMIAEQFGVTKVAVHYALKRKARNQRPTAEKSPKIKKE